MKKSVLFLISVFLVNMLSAQLPNAEKEYYVCITLSSGHTDCWIEYNDHDPRAYDFHKEDENGQMVLIPDERKNCGELSIVNNQTRLYDDLYFDLHAVNKLKVLAISDVYPTSTLVCDGINSFDENVEGVTVKVTEENGILNISFFEVTRTPPFYDPSTEITFQKSIQEIRDELLPSPPKTSSKDELLRISKNDFEVLPNPVVSNFILNIKNERIVEVFEIQAELVNMKGEIVLSQKIYNIETNFDVGKLPNGIYKFVLKNNIKNIFTSDIIIQK